MATEVFQIIAESSFEMDAPVRRGGRAKRVYRCRHCARIFKRSEHCARHERVHTQEKPFPCAFCDRRYARKDLVKRHERTLHVKQYRRAHPEEFRGSMLELGNSVSGEEEDTGSSNTTQNPASPLTPPTDANIARQSDVPDLSPFANVDPSYPHAVQTPMGFSPPLSATEQELRTSPSQLTGNMRDSDCFPLDIGFRPTQSMFPMSYAFDPGELDFESPSKRRRIEIDPLLLSNPASMHDTRNQPYAHSAAFSPSAIDPALDHCNFGRPEPQLSAEAGAPSMPFFDLSAECLVLFDSAACLPPHPGSHSEVRAPQVQKERSLKLPEFTFDGAVYDKICADARARLPSGELSEALFPTVNDLDRFFSGYLECFHRHFPIIHLPSLDLRETPSPLLFAMCSIGAQYRIAKQKAKNLFALAGTMSSYALRLGLPILGGTPKPVPIWIMQTRVLLSLCGMFSGKTSVVLRTVENLGLFAIDYRLRTSVLNHRTEMHQEWEEWISRESSKRLLCGMFIISNMISTTFGITPGFSHIHDLEFEVLDDENLWNAQTAQEWRDLKGPHTSANRPTVRQTMAGMVSGEQYTRVNPSYEISGLTMLLIMHAINIHMGSLRQVMSLAGVVPRQSRTSSIHGILLEDAFSALARCQGIITNSREREDQTTTWTEAEGPLMFNCQGLLLMAYTRLFSDTSAFNRLALLSDNTDDIASAVRSYTEASQQRSPSLTKVVRKAYERLLATVRIGHLYLRKTAALSWSLEHAVAGWDATLLLTKWIHTLETAALIDPPDAEESEILDGLKHLLSEVETEYNGSSLAAAVAHFCSTTLNDVWVWGVTPRMGHILEQLALAYEERHQNLQLGPFGYVVH